MTINQPTEYKVVFSPRDSATAETRAKAEDSFLRVLNSYVQSMAVRDPTFFANMSAGHIEYLCQLAYEGKPVDGPAGRSKQIADRIGPTDMEKITTTGKGLIQVLRGMQAGKADPDVRKVMINELIMYHRGRIKRKEHTTSKGFRRKPYPYLDDTHFTIVIPRKAIKNLIYDEEAKSSRFRCIVFSDTVRVEGIDLTTGHNWKHLRLLAKKSWRGEISDWSVIPVSTKLCYVRDQRR